MNRQEGNFIWRIIWLAASLVLFSVFLFLQSCSSNPLLYPVKVESVYGFIDYEGNLRIAPQYLNVRHYAEGLAPVQTLDGSFAYLNLEGEEQKISTKHGAIEKLDSFSEGLARVVVEQHIGYVDKQLLWVIEPQYQQAGRFSEGLAAVLDSSAKQGIFIDNKGEQAFVLDNTTALGPMRAGFAYFVRNGLFGIVNKQGKIVKEPSFLFLASADPESGLARAQDHESELYGFVDQNGAWVISPRYPNARDFSGGFAPVYLRKQNRYGYIDSRGSLRIEAQFLEAGGFHDDFAWVRTQKGYRYINRDGDWLSPLVFSQAQDFYEGLASAVQGKNRLYLDKSGNITWPNQE